MKRGGKKGMHEGKGRGSSGEREPQGKHKSSETRCAWGGGEKIRIKK